MVSRRHAAALTLLGWYLMGPPPIPDSWWSKHLPWTVPHEWNRDAPLSSWTIQAKYQTQKECEEGLAATRRANADYIASSILAWQCVSSDDPRLAR
jgi:hypothetical protein